MKNNILILGGNGLVGSSFNFGKKANRNDADLTDLLQVIRLIQREKPDWIINCAGYVGGVKANMDYKFDFFKQNMIINLNVIQASMYCKVPNLISFLSTCIFPEKIARLQPLKEEDLHEGEPHNSNYSYAYSKRMVDVLSRIAREQGFNYSCIIPTNIYGFNDNYNLETSHIIPALIRKFHKAYYDAIETNKSQVVEIWGSGLPLREFIFANDIPKVVNHIIENDVKFENFILSSSHPINIKTVVEMIKKLFDEKFPLVSDLITFEFNKSYPDGQFAKTTDTKKFKSIYPHPLTPLEDGLKETIEYFILTNLNNKELLKL